MLEVTTPTPGADSGSELYCDEHLDDYLDLEVAEAETQSDDYDAVTEDEVEWAIRLKKKLARDIIRRGKEKELDAIPLPPKKRRKKSSARKLTFTDFFYFTFNHSDNDPNTVY